MQKPNEKDPGLNDQDNGGLPTPKFSDQDGAQDSSKAEVDLDGLFKNPKFTDFLDQRLQAVKDRRIGKLQGEIGRLNTRQDSFEATIAKYQGYIDSGLSKDQAIRELKLDALLEGQEQNQGIQDGQPVPNGNQLGAGSDWAAVQKAMLNVAGMEENDPGFIRFVTDTKFANETDYLKKLGSYLTSRADNTPSEGAIIQPSGGDSGQTKNQTDLEKITADLDNLLRNPTANKKQIAALREQSRQLLIASQEGKQ